MKRPLPLHRRVALAYAAVGLALSLAFGIAIGFIVGDYEVVMVEALLEGQSHGYLDQLEKNPQAELPRTPGFSVYREAEAPPELQGLPDGRAVEIERQEEIHAAAFGPPGGRVVMVLDVGNIESIEDYLVNLFLGILVIGTALAAWLGWLLAGRTIAPVLNLADKVDALPVTPVVTDLAHHFGRDEIGRLASAIDAYQTRLEQADAKGRAFFADASHELRTPIAVIQGAVEVLKDDPSLGEAPRLRLARVERGLVELGGLLEALLLSARGLPVQRDRVALDQRCLQVLERLAAAGLATERIRVSGEGPRDLEVPQRWMDAILDVMFQRVLGYQSGLHWDCLLDAEGLRLRPTAASEENAAATRRSDLGVGLAFVERLCSALGWRLEQAEGDHGPNIRLCVGRVASTS